eukprot:gene9144-18946_t
MDGPEEGHQSTVGSEQFLTTKLYGTRSRKVEATMSLYAADKAERTPMQTRKTRANAARTPVPTRVQTNMHAYMQPTTDNMPSTGYLEYTTIPGLLKLILEHVTLHEKCASHEAASEIKRKLVLLYGPWMDGRVVGEKNEMGKVCLVMSYSNKPYQPTSNPHNTDPHSPPIRPRYILNPNPDGTTDPTTWLGRIILHLLPYRVLYVKNVLTPKNEWFWSS